LLQAGLMTIDLSDTHNPISIQGPLIGGIRGEYVAATQHHPALLIMQTASGVRIYDLTIELNPTQMSFTPMPVFEAAADGDTAYLAEAGFVQSMDLSDPAHPSLTTTSMKPVSPMQLAISKGKLVIADRYSLRIYGPNTPPPPAPPPIRRPSAH